MAVATAVAVAGLALAAVGTGVGVVGSLKQAKASKKAAKLQRQQQILESRRQRRRVLRERRIAQAQLVNTAAQTGAQGSSGEAGGLSSLSSQAGFELGVIGKNREIGGALFSASKDFAAGGRLKSVGSGLTDVGGSLFGARSLFK